MITLWVKSRSCVRPRRMHRWRIGDSKTICGLHAVQMWPVSTKGAVMHGIIPPKKCHVCFKYNYRFLSMRGMRK